MLIALTAASCAGPGYRCPARQVAELAVESRDGVPIVATLVQGRPAAFIVDTGTRTSTISAAAVDRLDLDVSLTHSYLIHAFNGSFIAPAATAGRISLGAAVSRNVQFAVTGDYGPARHGIIVDGLLGADLLSRYDVDLDLARDRIGLYEKAGCAPVPPPADGDRDGLAFDADDDQRIRLRIGVNGQAADALLDSGAQQTILAQAVVMAARVEPIPVSGHDIVATGIDGHPVRLRLFLLASLQIGPVRQQPAEARVADIPDALIGADFLRSHRVWIAYSRGRLFITDAPGA